MLNGLRNFSFGYFQKCHQPLFVRVQTALLQVQAPYKEEFPEQSFVAFGIFKASWVLGCEPGAELVGDVIGEGFVEFPEGMVHFFYFLFEDFEGQFEIGFGGRVSDLFFFLEFAFFFGSKLFLISFEVGFGDLLWPAHGMFKHEILFNVGVDFGKVEVELDILCWVVFFTSVYDCA